MLKSILKLLTIHPLFLNENY